MEFSAPGPPIDGSHRVGFEDEDYFDFAWWDLATVLASSERFYPGQLPVLLPRHAGCVAGCRYEEPEWRKPPWR